jgi:hypothetical protein
MTHVASHCGGVGDIQSPPELPEIPVVIKNHTRLNLAVALFKWPGESDDSFTKRDQKLRHLIEKMYELAKMTKDDPVFYHPPSYVHPEP